MDALTHAAAAAVERNAAVDAEDKKRWGQFFTGPEVAEFMGSLLDGSGSLAAGVRVLRDRRSQTQAEFAADLGCAVSTVSKWERRETVPAPKQRRRMEAMGTEAGFPASEWPEESKQTNLFQGGGR